MPRTSAPGKTVRRMLDTADAVWVSTRLAQACRAIRPDAMVIENRLDERIWVTAPPRQHAGPTPVRILCMGTSTHDQDFALIEPALARLKEEYGDRVVIDIIGMTNRPRYRARTEPDRATAQCRRVLPRLRQLADFAAAALAHRPGAVARHTRSTAASRRSRQWTMRRWALAVLASDVPVYQGSLADGPAGQLVQNDPDAWYAALDWLVRDHALRRTMARQARDAFLAQRHLGERSGATPAAPGPRLLQRPAAIAANWLADAARQR